MFTLFLGPATGCCLVGRRPLCSPEVGGSSCPWRLANWLSDESSRSRALPAVADADADADAEAEAEEAPPDDRSAKRDPKKSAAVY